MRLANALLALGTLTACTATPKSVHVVPFVTGPPAFPDGDSIQIDEIVGTRPRLEVGGVYVVSGHVHLVSRDGARLAIFSTGSGNQTRTDGYKNVDVAKGDNEFHLAVAILADGDLHLLLSDKADTWANDPFGGVYFRDPDRPFLYGGVQRIDSEPKTPNR